MFMMQRIQLLFFIILLGICEAMLFDPCKPGAHKDFTEYTYLGSRNAHCNAKDTPAAERQCDYFLAKEWYSAPNATILNKCPDKGDCGVIYPVWINGPFPSVSDGSTNMTACIKMDSDCCNQSITVQVKNCTDFLVYYLDYTPICSSVYCFESNLPCEEPTTPAPTTTTTSSSAAPTTSLSATTSITDSPRDSNNLLLGAVIGGAVFLVVVAIASLIILKKTLLCKNNHSDGKVSGFNTPPAECYDPPPPYQPSPLYGHMAPQTNKIKM